MRKKIIFFTIISLFSLASTFVYQQQKFDDNKLHVIFCDVGQGDGILIVTPKLKYILIDAGPDKKILECLAKHMPFWARKIDLLVLTHPHLDHFFGMNYVIDQYDVASFATENLANKSGSYKDLMDKVSKKKIPTHFVSTSDTWKFPDGVVLSVKGPSHEYLEITSPNNMIGDSHEFASLVTVLSYGTFDVFMTGDSQAEGVTRGLSETVGQIEILQVPHHGSASGLDDVILDQMQPKHAVISVGSKNRYGHPTSKIINLLKNKNIKVFRTDLSGDVEILSDGQKYLVN